MSYGPCKPRRARLDAAVIAISDDVRLRREKSSNLYIVELFDYGCGWYALNGKYESHYDAESRGRYHAGL